MATNEGHIISEGAYAAEGDSMQSVLSASRSQRMRTSSEATNNSTLAPLAFQPQATVPSRNKRLSSTNVMPTAVSPVSCLCAGIHDITTYSALCNELDPTPDVLYSVIFAHRSFDSVHATGNVATGLSHITTHNANETTTMMRTREVEDATPAQCVANDCETTAANDVYVKLRAIDASLDRRRYAYKMTMRDSAEHGCGDTTFASFEAAMEHRMRMRYAAEQDRVLQRIKRIVSETVPCIDETSRLIAALCPKVGDSDTGGDTVTEVLETRTRGDAKRAAGVADVALVQRRDCQTTSSCPCTIVASPACNETTDAAHVGASSSMSVHVQNLNAMYAQHAHERTRQHLIDACQSLVLRCEIGAQEIAHERQREYIALVYTMLADAQTQQLLEVEQRFRCRLLDMEGAAWTCMGQACPDAGSAGEDDESEAQFPD